MILVNKYTAINQLINSHLSQVLSIYTSEKKLLLLAKSEVFARKSKEICEVLYISEIAFKLAKIYGASALAIANQLVSHFCDCKENFMFKAVEGLIHIEVADSVIAVFLQSLVEQYSFPTLSFGFTLMGSPHSHTVSFSIQYAHARCCSLLLIALHEGLISFEQPTLQIPWLDSQGKLRFNSEESQRLIANLVEVVDDLVCVDTRPNAYWHSKALNLSQALICFWRHTRIWSEVKAKPELARAHIGLIVATQQILRFLLENKLDTVAWFEM